MATGDAINSDMAKTLLRKMKGQEPIPKKKEDKNDEMKVIIEKLGDIQDSLDTDSKEAAESRKVLVTQLLKTFDEKGLSIKEQKEILTTVNENLHETMGVLKTLNIGNINKFFTTISNPKLLGEAINKGFSSSNIGKALDVIPAMITKISNGFSRVFTWIDSTMSFLANPAEHLKSFGQTIVTKTSEFIEKQLKTFATFLWRGAIKPILIGLGRLTAQIIAVGIDITVLLIRMTVGFVFWLVTTIVPLLFTIIGFIAFTVVPMLFGIITSIIGFIIFTVIPFLVTIISAIAGAVISILAAITPILLIAVAILIIGIALGYLLYLAYEQIKKFIKYIFSQEFVDDVVNAAKIAINWVWDNIISPVWNGLKDFFQVAWDNTLAGIDAVKDFFVDVVWGELISPALDWITDVFKSVWDNLVEPIFTWIQDIFIAGWDAAVIVFNYLQETIDKIFKGLNKIGEGISSVASSVGDGLSSAWQWTTSWFATGGIVTKPTNAIIGEGGVSEAVIPLNKQGMQFIRDSFQIDDVAVQQIVRNSDLFKSQTKMQVTLDIISKDVKQIKFSLSEKKKENQIQNPPEVLVAAIKSDKLPQGEEAAVIFDIDEVGKLIENSDENILKKLDELMILMKNSATKGNKSEPLMNPGTSPVDSFHDLLKAISTGVLGVRQ